MKIVRLITTLLFLSAIGLLIGAYILSRQAQPLSVGTSMQSSITYVIKPNDFQWGWNEAQGQLSVSNVQGQVVFVSADSGNFLVFKDWARLNIGDGENKQLIAPANCEYVFIAVPVGNQVQGFQLGSNFNIECRETLWEVGLSPVT